MVLGVENLPPMTDTIVWAAEFRAIPQVPSSSALAPLLNS
jgi:hypothetical protein